MDTEQWTGLTKSLGNIYDGAVTFAVTVPIGRGRVSGTSDLPAPGGRFVTDGDSSAAARRAISAVISSPNLGVSAVTDAGLGSRRGHVIYSGVYAVTQRKSPSFQDGIIIFAPLLTALIGTALPK
jgi:hypothetical protein